MGWKWWETTTNSQETAQPVQNTPQSGFEQRSFVRSYSKTRTCRKDPEDADYLICTETTDDGNETTVRDERVPVHSGGYQYQQSNRFGKSYFDSPATEGYSEDLRNQFEHIDKEFGELIHPLFGIASVFNIGQSPSSFFNGFDFQQGSNQGQQRPEWNQSSERRGNDREQQKKSEKNNFYFSHQGEKDFNIKDI